MKKKLLFSLLALFCFFVPRQVWAKSYSIDSVAININVDQGGILLVEEKRTYNFDGDFTYAYQTVSKAGGSEKETGRPDDYQMVNFQICDQQKCYRRLTSEEYETADEQRPAGTFYVKEESDHYYIKWFYRAKNEQKNFIFSYLVTNGVTLQEDITEIYWKIVGADWEKSQRNIKAVFHLPEGIIDGEIQAWAHGPTTGKVTIPDNKSVHYSLAYLPAGEFFEARILLPGSLFFGGAQGSSNQAKIIAQEEKFIAKTINKKRREGLINGIKLILSLSILGFSIFIFIKAAKFFFKYGKNKKLPQVNLSGRLWEPPSDIDPAQIEQLLKTQEALTPKSFTATILSLVQKRVLKIVRSNKKQGFLIRWRFGDFYKRLVLIRLASWVLRK